MSERTAQPVSLLHEAHRDARHRAAHRHAGVQEGEGAAADRGHRRRAVGLQDVGHDANRVGEAVLGGQHLAEGPLGEGAVADLTAARAAEELHLPDREGREVVVEHEALLVVGLLHRVDDLRVLARSQGHRDERLCLAAGEEGRPVGARKHAHFAGDRADLVEAPAVEAAAVDRGSRCAGALPQSVVDGGHRGPLLWLVLSDRGEVGVPHLLHAGVGLELALGPHRLEERVRQGRARSRPARPDRPPS